MLRQVPILCAVRDSVLLMHCHLDASMLYAMLDASIMLQYCI